MSEGPEIKRERKRVLLLGWDAADWQHINPLLDQGMMPNLERLINNGVIGNLATMEPIYSPMLWNTIATGKLPDEHGILGFMEPDDVNGGARPVTSLSRRVKAIWNILNQEGYRSNVVGWWAGHPAEPINGRIVSPNIKFATRNKDGSVSVPPGTVHPPSLADRIACCRVFPDELTPDDVLSFIPKAAEIDLAKHNELNNFAKMLTECATIQAAATEVMSDQNWDFTAVYFDAIDHFCHLFMRFQAPQMKNVTDEQFEMYRYVVDGVYRFHDLILDVLWKLAGEDALVILCSDHGFLSGEARPIAISNEPAGPADWHRELGIVAMTGPGIKQDERVYGANLIDITPTILAYLDLPIGADMKGRPLLNVFAEPKEIETIPSWDEKEGDHGMHPPGTQLEAKQADELRQQFVALGYVDDHGKDLEKGYKSASTEQKYNLAQVYLGTSRPQLAKPLLEELLNEFPWEVRFIKRLAFAYFRCGFYTQCINLLEKAYPRFETLPIKLNLLKGRCFLELGRIDEALVDFEQVRKKYLKYPQLYIQLGRCYLQQNMPHRAKESFEKALELSPESAFAWEGLARTHLKLRNNETAADAALNAVGLMHHLPQSHYSLGVALARLKDYERAALAFEQTLHISPNVVNAHRWLHKLYSKYLHDPHKATLHQRECVEASGAFRRQRDESKFRATQTFDLPEVADRKTRREILMRERPTVLNRKKSGRTLVLVSGLPRSGTSLMMQMLKAGGLDPMTDGERVADVDNPEGYLEWEPIKKVVRDPSVLDDALLDTRATKVVSMLLPALPENHNYKIIFMVRSVEEVARSQQEMIERLQTEGADQSHEETVAQLTQHRDRILSLMQSKKNIDFIAIDFAELIAEPDVGAARVVNFLGEERLPRRDAMATAVRPELRRQKE